MKVMLVSQTWTEEGLLLHVEAGRGHLTGLRLPPSFGPYEAPGPSSHWPRWKLVHSSTANNASLFYPLSALAVLWRRSSKRSHRGDRKGYGGLKHSRD